jgi:hypothetical protein
VEAAIMSRKKADPKLEGRAKPQPTRIRSGVTNIRSSPEWKAWLQRFADFTRKDLADVVDEALLRYARAEGFELPPKR